MLNNLIVLETNQSVRKSLFKLLMNTRSLKRAVLYLHYNKNHNKKSEGLRFQLSKTNLTIQPRHLCQCLLPSKRLHRIKQSKIQNKIRYFHFKVSQTKLISQSQLKQCQKLFMMIAWQLTN